MNVCGGANNAENGELDTIYSADGQLSIHRVCNKHSQVLLESERAS